MRSGMPSMRGIYARLDKLEDKVHMARRKADGTEMALLALILSILTIVGITSLILLI